MTEQDEPQQEPAWGDRPKRWRWLESVLFGLFYLGGAVVYFAPAVVFVPDTLGEGDPFYLLDKFAVGVVFASFAVPLEILLWYGAGSKFRHISVRRVVAIGLIGVFLPCLTVAVMTVGLEIIISLYYFLLPAFPAGIVFAWAFVALRKRLLVRPL